MIKEHDRIVLTVDLPDYQLPAEVGARIHLVAQAVALAMKAAWSCDGVSTRQHNEPAGNQDVWHYHLHVTPRYSGDDFYATYLQRRILMPTDQRIALAAQLRTQMPNLPRA